MSASTRGGTMCMRSGSCACDVLHDHVPNPVGTLFHVGGLRPRMGLWCLASLANDRPPMRGWVVRSAWCAARALPHGAFKGFPELQWSSVSFHELLWGLLSFHELP